MDEMQEFNARIVEEFRGNGGAVGGDFAGIPLLLLTTTGARSGQKRVTPLVFHREGNRWVIFASKGGAPTNPDWYHNIVADPFVTVEVDGEAFEATAEILSGDERDRLFAVQAERMPNFADYAAATDRVIPVVALGR